MIVSIVPTTVASSFRQGTRKLTSTASPAPCGANSGRISGSIVALARPRNPAVLSAEQDVQERKNPHEPLATCSQPEAGGSRGDEICPLKLLETPRDHGLRPIECGDLGGFERMSRELRQQPERHAVPDQGEKENVEFASEGVTESGGERHRRQAVTPGAIGDQDEPYDTRKRNESRHRSSALGKADGDGVQEDARQEGRYARDQPHGSAVLRSLARKSSVRPSTTAARPTGVSVNEPSPSSRTSPIACKASRREACLLAPMASSRCISAALAAAPRRSM